MEAKNFSVIDWSASSTVPDLLMLKKCLIEEGKGGGEKGETKRWKSYSEIL